MNAKNRRPRYSPAIYISRTSESVQALSAPLAGAFSCLEFLRMGVEDLAMVFQGILESLRVKEQESIKSSWGIYLPKKIQRQCSAQQSPLHFRLIATIRHASGKHRVGRIKTDSPECLCASAQAGRKCQGQAHVCQSLSRITCLEEPLVAGRIATADSSAPNAATPRGSKESSTGGAISWLRLSASASRQCA